MVILRYFYVHHGNQTEWMSKVVMSFMVLVHPYIATACICTCTCICKCTYICTCTYKLLGTNTHTCNNGNYMYNVFLDTVCIIKLVIMYVTFYRYVSLSLPIHEWTLSINHCLWVSTY